MCTKGQVDSIHNIRGKGATLVSGAELLGVRVDVEPHHVEQRQAAAQPGAVHTPQPPPQVPPSNYWLHLGTTGQPALRQVPGPGISLRFMVFFYGSRGNADAIPSQV